MIIYASYKHRIKKALPLILVVFLIACSSTEKSASGSQQEKSTKKQAGLSEKDQQRATMAFIDANREQLLGNMPRAVELYQQSLSADPSNDAAYFSLARIYAANNNISQALNFAKQAATLDPENIWYQSFLGKINTEAGNYSEAIKIYSDLIERNPKNYDFYFELAAIYGALNDYEGAIKTYDALESQVGLTEELIAQKQLLYLELNKPEEAAREIQTLIDSNPDEVRYYGMLAEVYQIAGQEEKALQTYEKMLEMQPDNGMVHLSLSDYYRQNKQTEKAFESLKMAFKSQDLESEVKINVLLNYYNESHSDSTFMEKAFELLDLMEEAHPESGKTQAVYGDFLAQSQKFEEAREKYRNSLKIDPDKFAVWNQLLIVNIQLMDFEAVIKDGEECINLFPTQPTPYLYIGISHNQRKEYQKAIDILEAGKELVVENRNLSSEFYASLGDSYHNLNDNIASDEAYEKSIELNPSNALVLNNYSYYLSLRGEKLEKAEKMAKRANDLSPDTPSYQDTYGWVLYKRGNYQNAKFWLEQALKNGGSSSGEILEHLGDVLFKLNDKDAAVEYWKKAKEAGGNENEELLDKKINSKELYE